MRFVVDESTGAAVVEYLRAAGHDVLAVADIMPQADDHAILARAAAEGRVLLTNDKDFGELVFRSGHGHNGVVLLRLHDESSANRVRVLEAILNQYIDRPPFTVATGEQRTWAMGGVELQVNGRSGRSMAVFGPVETPPVLGAHGLEALGLGTDRVHSRLTPLPRWGFDSSI